MHSHSNEGAVRTAVTSSLDGLPRLRQAWEELFERSGREPSASFGWTSALTNHLASPEDSTLLITAWRQDRLVGALPLMARPGSWFRQRVVTLMPLSERCATHSDLLVLDNDDRIVDALLGQMLDLEQPWECFRMTKLEEGSPLTSALMRCISQRRLTFDLRDGSAEYYLPLPRSFDEYLRSRSAKFRNYLGRVRKRLARRGDVRIVTITEPSQFASAWDDILLIERASWKQEHGSSITEVPWQASFFRQVWQDALEHGRLDLQMLTVDGLPVAYNLGYVRDTRYYYLKTSYDAEYRYESPATVLRAALIERLIARGLTSFEFPGPAFEWEQQWTDAVRWYQELWLYNRTPTARLMAGFHRWKRGPEQERVVRHIDPRDPESNTNVDDAGRAGAQRHAG